MHASLEAAQYDDQRECGRAVIFRANYFSREFKSEASFRRANTFSHPSKRPLGCSNPQNPPFAASRFKLGSRRLESKIPVV